MKWFEIIEGEDYAGPPPEYEADKAQRANAEGEGNSEEKAAAEKAAAAREAREASWQRLFVF